MGVDEKDKIIDILKSAPAALEADDIEDFCTLAQYYASKTPQSFRRVNQIIHHGIIILDIRLHVMHVQYIAISLQAIQSVCGDCEASIEMLSVNEEQL